jgi:hypothetical protein
MERSGLEPLPALREVLVSYFAQRQGIQTSKKN